MSSGDRIPLAEAQALADELIEDFTPYCERIEVVGSIRRKREMIGDIEILCVPVLDRETDLFGEYTGEAASLLDYHCDALIGRGVLAHRLDKNGRRAFGARYKRLSYRGVGLDLFCVLPPAQFGVLSLIRTGSADWAHRLVTPVEQGGWCSKGCYFRDGALWTVGSDEPLHTPDERSVLDYLDLPWTDPELREVQP